MKSLPTLLTVSFLAFAIGLIAGCDADKDEIPVGDRVAVLVTDWGTPDGMDFNYYSQIGHRSRVGIEATGEDGQCEEDFNGVYPYRSFHGVYPHFLAFNTADKEKYEGAADWMARHFFTGGIMPSQQLFENFQEVKVVVFKRD